MKLAVASFSSGPERADLPEMQDLLEVLEQLAPYAVISELTRVQAKGSSLPVYGIVIGPQDRAVPTLAITAGVHGLERIGSRVIISYLKTLAQLLRWDHVTRDIFKQLRLVVVPIVNPGGMLMRRRSNPNGVDLMRNAPVESDVRSRFLLVAGHRISPKLPWYRGTGEWEPESGALVKFMKQELFEAKASMVLDIHSGFGTVDRLWFPYAKTKGPFPHIAEMTRLKQLLDQTHPNHIYVVEPQSQSYTTHGDLWDYLYDEHIAQHPGKIFLPMALELGSWLWVKKNPRQIFTLVGAFNPLIPHRYQRILRRHVTLLEFLQRATLANEKWAFPSADEKAQGQALAKKLWFSGKTKS